ncbi:hypothetical protein ABPG77_007045 [Micractinium sp. CCAP 211/92]
MAAGYGGATPLFPSQRYKLPPECAKHTVLYGGIYADLAGVLSARPGGITEADLEACGIPYATNKPDAWAVSDVRRLLMYDNSLYALEDPWTWRNRSDGQRIPLSGQHYWALLGIEEVAQRWGLPNLEFVLPLRDCGVVNAPNANGSLCISLSMAKQRHQFDFTIPEGQFIEYVSAPRGRDGVVWMNQVDKWVREEDPFPWEEKEEKAIARYTGFCPYWAALPKEMRLDRYGNEITCPRTHYVDLAKNSSDALDVGCNSCQNSPADQPANYIKLSDQRRWKYALETDGWGPSARFYKLLGGGWTVLKDFSLEHLWFIPALQPWVHYIPVRWNGPDEAARLVRWLRANDHVARSVAQNAKQFARAHLTDEGRMCYIKVLFEELAGLYRFSKRPEQYSRAVPIHEEINALFSAMAAPDAAAVAAQGAAADLAIGDVGLTGSTALAEPTLLDLIVCDHRYVATLFSLFEAAAQRQSQHEMQMLAAALVVAITAHSQAEEAVLYPLLEGDAAGSTDSAVLALTCREEHRLVEADMRLALASVGCALGGPLPPGTTPPLLEDAVQRLQANLSAHMVNEERMVLPRLAAAYSSEALVLHGRNFAAAKLATSFATNAPTGRPTWAAAAAAPAAPVQADLPGGEGKVDAAPAGADTAGEQPMAM